MNAACCLCSCLVLVWIHKEIPREIPRLALLAAMCSAAATALLCSCMRHCPARLLLTALACVLLRRIMGTGGQIVVAPRYKASTGVTFYFNATPVDFNTAEASCTASGGHIAGYSSRAEQVRAACCNLPATRCAPCIAPVHTSRCTCQQGSTHGRHARRDSNTSFWMPPRSLRLRSTTSTEATSSLPTNPATGWAYRWAC